MGTTDLLLRVMVIAMIGWLASSYRIVQSQLKPHWRRAVIIPLWFVWMSFALGGPVYAGALPLREALTTGASFTVGMSMYLLLSTLRSRTNSQ